MYKKNSRTKPLHLRKITNDALVWNNFLVKKGQRQHFKLSDDNAYSVSLFPCGAKDFNYNIGLLIEVDGIPAPLWLTSWPLTERIREYVSEHKVRDIPLQLRVELIESALKPLLTWMNQQSGARIRIVNFLTLKPTQVNQSSVCFKFYEGDSRVIHGMLIVHDKLHPFIEEKLNAWPSTYNANWDELHTIMQLEVGYLFMTLQELQTVEAGDVLFLITPEDITNQNLRLRLQSDEYYRINLTGNGINVQTGAINMSEEYSEAQEHQAANLGEMPVRLTFDLGELTMPFDNVKYLRPHYVIDLNQSFSELVKIRSQNKLIGTGELVDINGKVGVRVLELFGVKANG